MIIKDNAEINTKLEDMYSTNKALFIHHKKNGNIAIQNYKESSFYLAYFNGQWYSAKNKKKGGSQYRNTEDFLMIALDNIWYLEPKGNNLAEFSTPKRPLSKDHHAFIIFCFKMRLYIVVADGSKSENFIFEEFCATPNMWKFLFMSVCAMIRQYDSSSADEIEEFWKEEIADPVLDPKNVTKRCIFTSKDDDEQESF